MLLRQGQPPMPALQACCLRDAFVLKVHVAQREEQVGGRARHRVHEERDVARLRQRCLAAMAHTHRQVVADAAQGAGTTCWTDLAAPHQKRPWRAPAETQRR